MLDHLGFTVSDYGRSKAFYEEALAPLEIALLMEPGEGVGGFGRTASRSSGSRRTATS